MAYNWNWPILWTEPYGAWLLYGIGLTILIALAAWSIALTIGSLIGILRTWNGIWPRRIGAAYVQVFRNIPLLIQMFLWYFVIPDLLPADWGHFIKRDLPYSEFWTAVVALGFYTAARVGEQVRAGINAISAGERMAILAVGMTEWQSYVHFLLPVAFRRIILPLTSEFLSIVKNSSLALTIGALELTAQARRIESETFQGFEAFAAATVLYLAIAVLVLTLMKTLERRASIPGMIVRSGS